ncbi:MAG: ATP-binding protein [Chloroflexota bacterium]
MIKSLYRRIFPTYQLEETQLSVEKERILYFLLIPLFGSSLVLGIIGLFRTMSLREGVGISFISAAFFFYLLAGVRKGRLRLPSYLIPAAIILFATFAGLEDGYFAPRHITALFLGIIIASVLLNEAAIIGFGILSLIPIMLVPYLEYQGSLPTPDLDSLGTRLSIIVCIWLMVIFLLRFAVNNIQRSAEAARKNAEKLEVQNQELLRIQSQLEKRSADLFRLNEELQGEVKQREAVSQALLQSQEFSQHILHAIPDLILHIKDGLRITDIKLPSDELEKPIFNLDEKCRGKNLANYFPEAIRRSWADQIQHATRSKEELFLEYAVHTNADDKITYEARVLPSKQNEAILILRDSTIQKRKELAHQRSQRLESIGVLAGGIAHDFNNLLTGILGQASIALVKLEREVDPTKHIERMVLAAKRAADLTRQLLAYSGKGQFLIQQININQFIRESVFLLETIIPKNVKLNVEYCDTECAIAGDEGQIQQVILNLLLNASDALNQSDSPTSDPQINLKIEQVIFDEDVEDANIKENLSQGEYVAISIQDNGPGIPTDIISRIFEPYFSTKGLGRGLGLSAILGIIKGLNGGITVDSNEGFGTRFTIYIPSYPINATPIEKKAGQFATAMKGQVLIIDDERPVQEVASEICGLLGFNVLTADNGFEGLKNFSSHKDSISFILLDLQMPKMNGIETLKSIRQISSDVKIILTSGFTEVEFYQDSDDKNLTFIQKPFTFGSLQKTLQSFSLIQAVH